MKKLFVLSLLISGLILGMKATAQDQDKSKRPSPPAKVTQKIPGGATISIDYSQPSLKGRTIGKDIEPMEGKVWRTGANEATVFESDKDVTIDGKKLPAGKYGLFTVFKGSEVTFIFNKTWKQWGAFKYSESDDILKVKTKAVVADVVSEKLTFKIDAKGRVSLLWGDKKVDFVVK